MKSNRERADSVQVFTAVVRSAERGLAQLIEIIQENQKIVEKQSVGFIRELEEEISQLLKRNAKLEQLSHTEDHLQLIRSFSSINLFPPTKDWSEVSVHTSYDGIVRRALAELKETLSKEMISGALKWSGKNSSSM